MVRDSIQDVFFELINKRKTLNQAISIKLYLLASLRRRLIRLIAKEKRLASEESYNRTDGFNYSLNAKLIQHPSNYTQDEKKLIEIACNRLPKRQREAVMLYYFEELSYKEVADIMDLSNPKNARTLIYRALESLYHNLKNLQKEIYLLLPFLIF